MTERGTSESVIVDIVASSPGPIEVTGDGPLAMRVRELLGVSAASDAPGTIVETTGDVDQLERALERVRKLGTIVLAGPAPTDVALDVYADLHSRGLTVIGVPPG